MKYVLYGIIALVVLGVGGFVYLGQSSQSGQAAGLVDGKLSPCPSSPNCVSSEAGTPDDKKVEPLTVSAWDQIPAAIGEMGGVIVKQDDAYLAAEFTSATFGFVDDVEFRLADDALHIRSASRVGYSDRGVNLARVAALKDALDR